MFHPFTACRKIPANSSTYRPRRDNELANKRHQWVNCETGQDASSVLAGGDAALWVRLSVDIAQLVPRRSCLDRQGYGGTGASVPRAMRSRLRRNAQADSLAERRSHQA